MPSRLELLPRSAAHFRDLLVTKSQQVKNCERQFVHREAETTGSVVSESDLVRFFTH
jgi:hypothetical protein